MSPGRTPLVVCTTRSCRAQRLDIRPLCTPYTHPPPCLFEHRWQEIAPAHTCRVLCMLQFGGYFSFWYCPFTHERQLPVSVKEPPETNFPAPQEPFFVQKVKRWLAAFWYCPSAQLLQIPALLMDAAERTCPASHSACGLHVLVR